MMLVANGCPVRVKWDYGDKVQFAIENGNGTSQVVPSALIAKGDDILWSDEHVNMALKANGYGFLKILRDDEGINVCAPEYLSWYRKYYRESYSSEKGEYVCVGDLRKSSPWFKGKFDGQSLTEQEFDKMVAFLIELDSWDDLKAGVGFTSVFRGKSTITYQSMLTIMGEGKVVTPESLSRGCYKGSTRPIFVVGDSVKTKKITGVIVNIADSGITIQSKDGKKSKVLLACSGSIGHCSVVVEDLPEIDSSLKKGFDGVLSQGKYLYRAKVKEMESILVPLFPCEDQEQAEYKDIATCACPVCGWQMVKSDGHRPSLAGDSFECCFCRQRGIVVDLSEDEVILRLNRLPSKNQFAIREASCCSNCGNFHFSSGSQGKRSTGYCLVSNQCLQAFNTCDYWMPRSPYSYEANTRQHVTNLGYGVKDHRNTTRNDIRDTIYRKEDHEEQKKRSEAARTAYSVHHAKFMNDLKELGRALPLVGDTVEDEMKEHYKKILGGGVDDSGVKES